MKYRDKGFTLLELAVVLTIIGVIISGGLVVLTAATKSSQFNATVAKMDAINKALLDYSNSFYRLPCPGDLTLTSTDISYGKEAVSMINTCYGGTPSANFKSTTGVVEGAVPVRSLQLPDDYMYDAWGHKFRYAVNPSQTVTGSYPPTAGGLCTNTAPITVNDASGTSRTSTAVYALISHGSVGHGSYTKNGTVFIPGSSNTDELTNCHCDGTTGAAGTYTATYVQKLPTQNSTVLKDQFDDIVSFREAWQMQTGTVAMAAACTYYVWVSDNANHRVMKFDSNGNYITSLGGGYHGSVAGSCGSGNGQLCNPQGLAVDSSDNVYVSESWVGIRKFTNAGVYVSNYLSYSTGSANNTLGTTSANIYFDPTGNLWAVDTLNYRISEFSAAGSNVRTRGGPSPHTCETTPSGSIPACAQGTGSGQYYYPYALTMDTANNAIWVADGQAQRIVRLDNTGAYVSQLPCAGPGSCSSGTTSGLMSGSATWGIAADTSGNIYLTDQGNVRVTKYNSATGYVSQFPCPSGQCTNGSGAGQFSSGSPDQIAIAPDGSIWVGDYANNRVEKFDANGNFKLQLGCGFGSTTGCASNTIDGYFNQPEAIAFTKN